VPCTHIHIHIHILDYDEKATINLILEVIQLVGLTHDPTSIHIIEKKKKRQRRYRMYNAPYCELYKDISFMLKIPSTMTNYLSFLDKLDGH
jgi:hypothetical protein